MSTTAWNESYSVTQGNYLYTTQHSNHLGQVIYSSESERVITIIITAILLIFSLLGQAIVIVTIAMNEHLHTSEYFIVIGNCVADFFTVMFLSSLFLLQLIDNRVPVLACHAISTIAIAVLQSNIGG